jgi:hypothetical protein
VPALVTEELALLEVDLNDDPLVEVGILLGTEITAVVEVGMLPPFVVGMPVLLEEELVPCKIRSGIK